MTKKAQAFIFNVCDFEIFGKMKEKNQNIRI